MTGKNRRMKRLFQGAEGRSLLVPLDHGAWLGPAQGIHHPTEITRKVIAGGANALLIGPGFARKVASLLDSHVALVLRTSLCPGLAPEATQEVPVATLETALRLDADAVAISIFFGRGNEVEQIRYLGEMIESCALYDMPVLAEMLPSNDSSFDAEAIAHAARIGFEMGADVIKTNYCGDVAAFRDVVASSPAPILVAGGPNKGEDVQDILDTVRDVLAAGGAGVAFGRRVWGSHDPEDLVRKMREVIFPRGTDG